MQSDNITFDGAEIIGWMDGLDRSMFCEAGNVLCGFILQATKLQEFDNTGTIMGLTLKNAKIIRWNPYYTGCNATNVFAMLIGNMGAYTPIWSSPSTFTNV